MSDALDRIYEALDAGDPELSLRICLDQITETGDQDPVLQFFAGKAWMEMGEPGRAIPYLEQAGKLDPEDLEFKGELGLALFEDSRFEAAAVHVAEVLKNSGDHPDGHHVLGLLAERENNFEEADLCFGIASSFDKERYPPITRLTAEMFQKRVEQAAETLPEPFHSKLGEVTVLAEPIVPDSFLEDGISPAETLGLFTGTIASEKGAAGSPGDEPARIVLFQRNLERYSAWGQDLEEQIAVTLFHELGHYLGMEEEELEQAGFL
jgi:predicted Zn-dependent protease with MMP-like domain